MTDNRTPYQDWVAWVRSPDNPYGLNNPSIGMTAERIEEICEATTQFGPANCWSGTTGQLAGMIRELLRERVAWVNPGTEMRDE